VAVGVSVGVGVMVYEEVAVKLGVAVAVSVNVRVGLEVLVSVKVGVFVGVIVAVAVGVSVQVSVTVGVSVSIKAALEFTVRLIQSKPTPHMIPNQRSGRLRKIMNPPVKDKANKSASSAVTVSCPSPEVQHFLNDPPKKIGNTFFTCLDEGI
jgi:hypothetical protein